MLSIDPGIINKIAQFELFKGSSRDVIEKALSGAKTRNCKHREFVYRAGEDAQTFCIVVEGALKLIRHSPRGEDIIMHFAVEGDVVGALLMNQKNRSQYPVSVKSMGPSKILCIPKITFQDGWQSNLELQKKLNSVLYHRMTTIQDDKTMLTSPLRARIASFLLRHLDQNSEDQNQVLSLGFTRQEIADSLGVAVESVIRVIRDWQDDGTVMKLNDKGLESINIQKLLKQLEY